MANSEHVALVKKGAKAIAAWRKAHPDTRLDLRSADLREACLATADLTGADVRACLMGADLRVADLTDADLAGADLRLANLWKARMTHADLRVANLTAADLTAANLGDADLTGAIIGWTILADVDLAHATGLADVKHGGPSSVGVDTLARTLRSSGGQFTEEQLLFFTGAGVPATLLDYLPDLLETNPLQFYSCFISYSTKDEAFASALHADLEKAGVKTYKWDLDGVVGRDLMENVDLAIRNYDKMILICSQHSLASKGVDKEIVKALQKEEQLWNTKRRLEQKAQAAGEEPPFVDVDVLVPVWLDGSVERWESPYASEVKKKMAADFRGVTPGSEKYQKQLARLIHALNPKTWPPKPPRSAR